MFNIFCILAIFGKDLSCQFVPSVQSAPLLVLRCIHEIETRGAAVSSKYSFKALLNFNKILSVHVFNVIFFNLNYKTSIFFQHTHCFIMLIGGLLKQSILLLLLLFFKRTQTFFCFKSGMGFCSNSIEIFFNQDH